MNKIFMFLVFSFLYVAPGLSQSDNDYDDLLELYVDEKYERLIYKAEDYTLKEKTKKDPLPYLYLSMGCYELSKDETKAEKFPKAFKNALKYAGKFVKKDKEGAFAEDAEDYFADLREDTMEEAENQMVNEKWTKAKGTYKYLVNLDKLDPGAKLYMAYATFRMRSVREAELMLDETITILDERKLETLGVEQKNLLKNSIIAMVEWSGNSDYREKIISILEKTKDYLGGDKEFDRAYNSFI